MPYDASKFSPLKKKCLFNTVWKNSSLGPISLLNKLYANRYNITKLFSDLSQQCVHRYSPEVFCSSWNLSVYPFICPFIHNYPSVGIIVGEGEWKTYGCKYAKTGPELKKVWLFLILEKLRGNKINYLVDLIKDLSCSDNKL